MYYCIEQDCKKQVSRENSRCHSCENKRRWKNEKYRRNLISSFKKPHKKMSEESKKNMARFGNKNRKGIPHTEETKKRISDTQKNKWKNSSSFRDKIIKNFKIKPNKCELFLLDILRELFPNEYKYVGDFKFFIEGFNPDFININGQKKIIEHFGTYWHNREGSKENDKLRLKAYKEYGYKTLVIWQKELKNVSKLKEKLKVFHND